MQSEKGNKRKQLIKIHDAPERQAQQRRCNIRQKAACAEIFGKRQHESDSGKYITRYEHEGHVQPHDHEHRRQSRRHRGQGDLKRLLFHYGKQRRCAKLLPPLNGSRSRNSYSS